MNLTKFLLDHTDNVSPERQNLFYKFVWERHHLPKANVDLLDTDVSEWNHLWIEFIQYELGY